MGRQASQFPSYRLHRPSGQAVVTIAGQDIYLGPHGTAASRQEYDRRIAEWLAAGRPRNSVTGRDLTVVEACAAYWEYAKRYYTVGGEPTGEIHPVKAVVKLLRKSYGTTPANDFGPLSLKALRQKMIAKGWSRGTINKQVNRVRRIFRWAVSEELLPPSVIQALASVEGLRAGKTDARETQPVLPVDDAVIDATLPFLPRVVADMVRLQRLTGARPDEVCSLRPCDVTTSLGVWLYVPASHKNQHRGRSRSIYIGPRGQAILAQYLDRLPEEYCFSPREAVNQLRQRRQASRVTPIGRGNSSGTNRKRSPNRKPGLRYSSNSYRRAIHRACSRAKVAKWSPNQIRHTAGTQIRKQFGLEAAQVTLGHAYADVTQIYAERDMTLAARVIEQVG